MGTSAIARVVISSTWFSFLSFQTLAALFALQLILDIKTSRSIQESMYCSNNSCIYVKHDLKLCENLQNLRLTLKVYISKFDPPPAKEKNTLFVNYLDTVFPPTSKHFQHIGAQK